MKKEKKRKLNLKTKEEQMIFMIIWAVLYGASMKMAEAAMMLGSMRYQRVMYWYTKPRKITSSLQASKKVTNRPKRVRKARLKLKLPQVGS